MDDDLLAYLGGDLGGMAVADCGCGPGVVAEKLLQAGAAPVVAIDANQAMLRQLAARLPAAVADGRAIAVHATLDARLLPGLSRRLRGDRGFDLVLFKRSLYAPPALAQAILASAVGSLAAGGVTAIVHPARAWRRYALGPRDQPVRHTAYHLFNRLVSRLGVELGAGPYTLYSASELMDLASAVAGDGQVEWIPTEQTAYEMIAIRRAGGQS